MRSKKALGTAAWVIIPAISFGLGWMLKPLPPSRADSKLAADLSSHKSPRSTGRPVSGESANALTGPASSRDFGRSERPDSHRTNRPLSQAGITELGRQFKLELDPIAKRALFAELIQGMTADNAMEIREQIDHLSSNSPEFRDFHYAWGKIGGTVAVLHGAETRKTDMAATLAGWASADPAAARDWFSSVGKQSKENYASHAHLKVGMVHGLANADPALATTFVLDLAAAGDAQAKSLLGVVTGKVLQVNGPADAALWAEKLPAGKIQASAMERVAHDYALADPDAAIHWLESLPASTDASKAYSSAFEGWSSTDPNAAGNYLAKMPASSNRDHAIGGYIDRIRWVDPLSAIEWADAINNEKARNKSIEQAGQAYFRRDRKAASAWLASSGLPAETQKRITSHKR